MREGREGEGRGGEGRGGKGRGEGRGGEGRVWSWTQRFNGAKNLGEGRTKGLRKFLFRAFHIHELAHRGL